MEERKSVVFLASALLLLLGFLGASFFGGNNNNNNHAFAQSNYGEKPPVATTEQQLAECKQLGIKPEKCSEQAILSSRCLGPNEACRNAHVPVDVNVQLAPLYLGIAGAFAASLVYIKKTGRWKKSSSALTEGLSTFYHRSGKPCPP
jgi:hypothetical protein